MKERAILFGPCIGELFWEFFRFSPMLSYYNKKYYNKNIKFIVLTRPDRFDIYGLNSDILVSLKINGDGDKYKADCFRLIGYKKEEYNELIHRFRKQYEKRFDILHHIYPKLENKQFANKNQFNKKKMIYEWFPRKENNIIIKSFLPGNKPIIVLSPRYRNGMRRNWPHWNKFYDLIYSDVKLMNKYNFVICGKYPDYIPDLKNRFYDINNIQLNDNISTIGLTIESIKRSILTIGSQGGLCNISMLLKIPVLTFGHQRILHTNNYNIFKTKVHFIDDIKYNIEPRIIFNKMKKILNR